MFNALLKEIDKKWGKKNKHKIVHFEKRNLLFPRIENL